MRKKTTQVRNTWTREICRQGWAQDVRARVRGRIDLGREPTKAEVEEIITSGRFRMTTPDQIMKAYNSGEEVCTSPYYPRISSDRPTLKFLLEDRSVDIEVR